MSIALERRPTQVRPGALSRGSPDLAVEGLIKRFGGATVLDDVTFQLYPGEAIALIGANGAGKSTLLRCCLRLLPFEGGSVRLLGEDVGALSRRRLRRLRSRVGFIFQRHNLVPRASALTNVLHGVQARAAGPQTWHHTLARSTWRDEAMACLEAVGLAERALVRVDRLSGGQSQRVAIARSLMQRPRLVFADEPVASLDPRAGTEVMALFASLMREQGIAVLFTSHQVRHALDHADRVIALRSGRIALDAPTASQDPDRLSRIYACPSNA